MSKAIYKTQNFTIEIGWDAPFNHYFGNVYFTEVVDDDIIWSTMDEPDADFGGGFALITNVSDRIEQFTGVNLPIGFLELAAIPDMNQVRVYTP